MNQPIWCPKENKFIDLVVTQEPGESELDVVDRFIAEKKKLTDDCSITP